MDARKSPQKISRYKARYYDEDRDLFGASIFREGDSGYLFHLENERFRSPSTLTAEDYDRPSYIYFKKSEKLFYVNNNQIEEANITDIKEFKTNVKTIMNIDSLHYEFKLLSYEEVYVLITLNGGHTPTSNTEEQLSSENIQIFKEKLEKGKIINSYDKCSTESEYTSSDESKPENEENNSKDAFDIAKCFPVSRKRQVFQNNFYCKARDLYGSQIVENISPNETGVLHWVKEEKDVIYSEYCTHDYIFAEKCKKLYFVNDNAFELVNINNMEHFLNQFRLIMKPEDYKYVYQCLPITTIYALITSSNGCIPSIKKQTPRNKRPLEEKHPDMSVNPSCSTNQIFNALGVLPNTFDIPPIEFGYSFRGEKNIVTDKSNDKPKERVDDIPPGYKKMLMWCEPLQSFGLGIVPEDTPELTGEEIERYSSLNPM